MSETLIRTYLAAIEAGDQATAEACLDPAMIFEELPNKVSPQGSTRDLATIRASFAQGKALLASQRYEVVSLVTAGTRVIAEVVWTGQLRDGRILRQRNYDCFAPG